MIDKMEPEPVNKEAFKMLALEIGLNAACRKLDVPIPTGKSWARRGGWKLPKRTGGRPCRTLSASSASSLHPIADALASSHRELEERTKSGLARATARAAEAAAKAREPLPVSNTAQLRDLAASAARVFGWDKAPQTNVQVNTGFKLTMEQLEQMRALCDNPFKKATISEGEETKDNKH
jgi:hypothetical protein